MSETLLSFEGRISRKPYWIFMLVIFVGSVLASTIDLATSGQSVGSAYVIFILAIIWPSLAVQVKRWHDRDKSGWWILINFIPVLGPLWALVENGFLSGTEGGNRFGADPVRQSV
jgi:uncharacterized membrane protein YhaH (DUF805 family)